MSDPNPERARLLALVADECLARGVSGLTLRGLARAAGSNNRMLLYYFGSTEHLIADGINEAAGRFPALVRALTALDDHDVPLPDRLGQAWTDISAEANLPFLRLFFELFGLAAHQPDKYGKFLTSVGTDWVEQVAGALTRDGAGDAVARGLAVEIVALWRGLQFALLSGAGRAEIDQVHAAAADAIAARLKVTSED